MLMEGLSLIELGKLFQIDTARYKKLLMMASAQVVETSVNTNNSPSQDYTTNPDDHSNHNKKLRRPVAVL